MFEQKKPKQNEQKTLSSSIESPEVDANDPLAPYRPHIDRFDLTEEQKLELVEAINTMAEIILDAHFQSIKQPRRSEKTVDKPVASINGKRHEK